MLQYFILLAQVPANKMELFRNSTMPHAPYLHSRLDLIIKLCRTFLIVAEYVVFAVLFYFEGPIYEDIYL